MNATSNPSHRCRTSPGALLTTAVIAGFLGFMIGHGVGRNRVEAPYDGAVSTAPAGDINAAPGAPTAEGQPSQPGAAETR